MELKRFWSLENVDSYWENMLFYRYRVTIAAQRGDQIGH